MAPRKKKEAALVVTAQEVAGFTTGQPGKDDNTSDNDLIAEEIKIDDFIEAQTKAFGEFLKPHKERQDEIQKVLLGRLIQRGADNTSCDAGTAYKSTLLNVKIDHEGTEPYEKKNPDGSHLSTEHGREAFLDFALDNWETFGQDGLMFSAQKDSVKKYIEEHGKPPPGIKISYFTRVNIRRS